MSFECLKVETCKRATEPLLSVSVVGHLPALLPARAHTRSCPTGKARAPGPDLAPLGAGRARTERAAGLEAARNPPSRQDPGPRASPGYPGARCALTPPPDTTFPTTDTCRARAGVPGRAGFPRRGPLQGRLPENTVRAKTDAPKSLANSAYSVSHPKGALPRPEREPSEWDTRTQAHRLRHGPTP